VLYINFFKALLKHLGKPREYAIIDIFIEKSGEAEIMKTKQIFEKKSGDSAP
jgi:hypothetical protein